MKSVTFDDPVAEVFQFEGVRDEERDDVWFRRADYVEFVEHELRRRELLSQIENQEHRGQRRSSDTDARTVEASMKHTFTRRMVSRTFSAGPIVRRKRLPQREKNELDVSNHASHLALGKQRQQLRQKQQQQQKETENEGTAGDLIAATPAKVESQGNQEATSTEETTNQPDAVAPAPAAVETKLQKDQPPQQPRRSTCDDVATPTPGVNMESLPVIKTSSPPQALTV